MLEKILVLSTAHITVETNHLLEKASNQPFDDSSLPFRVTSHEYGFILFLGIEIIEEEFKSVPKEVTEILKYAVKTGCTFVNFDRDAELNFTFPTFDWDTTEILKDEL